MIDHFLNSNYKVHSRKKLEKYIDICLTKNNKTQLRNDSGRSKTAKHHILPKSIFPEFSNLVSNEWNSTYLYFSDHYYVHWLLCGIFGNNNYKMNEAFLKMHNCDVPLGRITEKDLINGDDFQLLVEETLSIRSIRAKEYMNKKIILPSGEKTTIAKENGKKISKALNKKYIDEQGNITTIAFDRVKNRDNFISVIDTRTGNKLCVSSNEYNSKDYYKSTAKKKYSKEEIIKNIERQTTIREVIIGNYHYTTKSGISLRKWLSLNNLPSNVYSAVRKGENILKLGKNNKFYNKFNGEKIKIKYESDV
jgi:hypothetical protein